MGVKIRKPRNLGMRDIFLFWLKNMEKKKPYLKVKRRNFPDTKVGRCTEVWYTVKDELKYLNKRLLKIDIDIQELEVIDLDKYQFTTETLKIFELRKEAYECRQKMEQLKKLDPEEKKLLMTYALFSQITTTFNKKAVKAVIQGDNLYMGNRLGYLRIKKIARHSQSIDWGASLKYKKELLAQGVDIRTKENTKGKNWFVYRDCPFYLRWQWAKTYKIKKQPMIRNQTVYALYPTANSSNNKVLGAKGLLAEANRKNKLLHLRYEILT